jgi:endonuclease G
MKKLLLVLLLVPVVSFGQLKFLPSSNGEVVEHTYYSLSYLEEHEQAEWVHYKLNSSMLKGEIPRKKNYTLDRKVSTGSAKTSDYTNSGFDRGHLVPAADMKMDFTSVKEAAYMSNISPQKPKFNQGVWKKLEENARDLAKKTELYITTGGVLSSADLKKIGKNNLSVPDQFYKIIYDTKNQKMFAYLMPNKKIDSREKYVVTVDSIETLTGIDFYHQLDDELENKLESIKNNLL